MPRLRKQRATVTLTQKRNRKTRLNKNIIETIGVLNPAMHLLPVGENNQLIPRVGSRKYRFYKIRHHYSLPKVISLSSIALFSIIIRLKFKC
jgi:hypothetical protein